MSSKAKKSMQHPLTQRRFGVRRKLIGPTSRQSHKQQVKQSTLTQLDFVSTPTIQDLSDHSIVDSEEDSSSSRPTKRRRVHAAKDTRSRDSTLTQIGFISSANTGDSNEDEIIRDSQASTAGDLLEDSSRARSRDNAVSTASDCGRPKTAQDIAKPVHRATRTIARSTRSNRVNHPVMQEREGSPAQQSIHSVPSSVRSTIVRTPTKQKVAVTPLQHTTLSAQSTRSKSINPPTTPKDRSTLEIPSSYTPASALLLTKSQPSYEAPSSPLRERSTNIEPIPERRSLKRITTIQDSDSEDVFTPQSTRFRDEFDDLNDTYTATVEEQFTYDPAESALDRDAARAAWTQMLQSRIPATRFALEEKSSPPVTAAYINGLASPETATRPRSQHQSQISTMPPTQSSPPSLYRSARTERLATTDAITISSSPIQLPPSTYFDSLDRNFAMDKEMDSDPPMHLLSDYSLALPPPLPGSTSRSAFDRSSETR